MLFLSLDVFDQVIDVAPGARKGGVSLLPVRKAFEDGVLFDPERRAGLDLLHEIRHADRGVQAAKNVNVIFHPIDAVKMTVAVLDDAPHVAEEVISALARENVRAVFGANTADTCRVIPSTERALAPASISNRPNSSASMPISSNDSPPGVSARFGIGNFRSYKQAAVLDLS
jgi:hypothetical protein